MGYSVKRVEQRQVEMTDDSGLGRAIFLNGDLWALDLGPVKENMATLPLPRDISLTPDRLTGYIEFLRTVRAECRRIKDGAQEVEE